MVNGSNIACVYHVCRWIEIELSSVAANLACGEKGDRHLFSLGRTKVDQSKFPTETRSFFTPDFLSLPRLS